MARKHQAGPQQQLHRDLENLQDDEEQLWGRSKVSVRIWTFRGAEKESESDGERREEPSASWDVPPTT